MIAVLRRGRLQGVHLDAGWIDAAHDMFHGPALAGGIERLKNQEHAPIVLRVELLLELAQHAHALGERGRRDFFLRLEAAGATGVDVLQSKLAALGDDVRLDELVDSLLGHPSMPPLVPVAPRGGGLAASPGDPDRTGG